MNAHPAVLAVLCAGMAAWGGRQVLRGWRQGEILSRGGLVYREADPIFFWFMMVMTGVVMMVSAFVALMIMLGK